MSDYIETFRALLRGETVEWEGARMRMLHPDGSGAPRPLDVPVLVGAIGPRGQHLARRLGDGLFVTTTTGPLEPGEFDWVAYLYWGTVLAEGEDAASSTRVQAAAGPGGALAYHATYELAGPEAVAAIPGGAEWLAAIAPHPESERHLAVHDGHCIHLNDADHAAWAVTAGALLPDTTVTGSPAEVSERIDALGAAGVTEVVYQPSGPDIRRELETMYAACTA